MKKHSIILVVLTLLLLAVTSTSAERNKVAFQHVLDKTLKTDCVEIKGKHDAVPHYTCYDDKNKKKSMKPAAKWRLVETKKVCFLHKVTDMIRSCIAVTPLDKSGTTYTCFEGQPPTFGWIELKPEDNRCAERLKLFDPPKTMTFSIFSDLGEDSGEQE
ncbi:MAG: hypothetical protein D3903_05140 [Candidatus Electrothrix sp. GM3_4]|nr:hypothetical protein [Candidatus Electrothrix sp. GM3_4]